VGVAGAHIEAALAAQPLEPYPDIGLDILHQVAQMDGAVGVGKGTGDEDPACGVRHRRGGSMRLKLNNIPLTGRGRQHTGRDGSGANGLKWVQVVRDLGFTIF